MEGGRKGSGLGFSDGSRCIIVSGKCLGNGKKRQVGNEEQHSGSEVFFFKFS